MSDELSIGEPQDFTSISLAAKASITMLGGILQHQEEPRSESGSHFLKVLYAYWDAELDCR